MRDNPPSSLQNLTATVIDYSSIAIYILAPNDSSIISRYEITYYGVFYDTSMRNISIVSSAIGSNESFNITQLQAYTTYLVKVEAANNFGRGPSSVIVIQTSQSGTTLVLCYRIKRILVRFYSL